jgi:restriction system protein
VDTGINYDNVFAAFAAVAQFLFPFWILFLPLALLRIMYRKRKGSALAEVFLAWTILFLFRISMYVYDFQPMAFLIQEPLSTILFIVAGFFLIGFVGIRSYRKVKRIRGARSVKKLLELTPTEFEQAVGEMFKSHDYKVTHRGRRGDHGVDLVVRPSRGEKWVVQCKQWKGQVGEPVLRDIYGAMHHEKAQGAAVVTTGRFSRQAIAWAQDKPIELYDGERLGEILQKRKRE